MRNTLQIENDVLKLPLKYKALKKMIKVKNSLTPFLKI